MNEVLRLNFFFILSGVKFDPVGNYTRLFSVCQGFIGVGVEK